MIVGQSQCGISHFVAKLLKNLDAIINEPPERIVWCYNKLQRKLFDELSGRVKFNEGLHGSQRPVHEGIASQQCQRHVRQNLYNKGKENRTISLNMHYLVLFKNPRHSAKVVHLGRQIYPNRSKYLKESFMVATSRPHGYLLIDLKTMTPDKLRLRTAIFPDAKNFFSQTTVRFILS